MSWGFADLAWMYCSKSKSLIWHQQTSFKWVFKPDLCTSSNVSAVEGSVYQLWIFTNFRRFGISLWNKRGDLPSPCWEELCILSNDRFYLAVLDFNAVRNVPQRYCQNILSSKMNVYYRDAWGDFSFFFLFRLILQSVHRHYLKCQQGLQRILIGLL